MSDHIRRLSALLRAAATGPSAPFASLLFGPDADHRGAKPHLLYVYNHAPAAAEVGSARRRR
jgi:hypothetical protein